MSTPSTSSTHEILEVPLTSSSGDDAKRKVEICFVNGRFFASKSDSAHLESAARVCIDRNQSEADVKSWQYNSNCLPILSELVAVLVEFGFVDVFRIQMTSSGSEKTLLRIEEIPFENSREFRTKRLVVRDFWKRGYFIADGTRFGGDFLVYTASPNTCHAEFVLLCTPITDMDRIAAMRCCNQVKKTLILATTSSDSNQPHYTKCEWFRPELF